MPKVSVIIPVYNVEQYLSRCLDSVVNQTLKDIEIICVNDCSPDNSVKILERYAQADNRVKIISRKENGGLSAARNTGFEETNGEYVYFLDSDDWIDLDYIEKMVKAIEIADTDIVLNTNIIKEYTEKSQFFIWERYPKKLPGGEFLNKINAINKSQCMVWCHLYKKEFLDKFNLKFPKGYIHEDEYFQHISKFNTDKIFAFFGPPYHYTQRKDSIMETRENKTASYIKIFSLVYEFYKDLDSSNIKTIFPEIFHNINERNFLPAKEYLNLVFENFNKNKHLYSDYDRFLVEILSQSKSFDDFTKKAGKVPLVSYMTRYKIQRQKNIKASIIIPVYNVEEYLSKCLDSVVNQTLRNIEIICINDCSDDNSFILLQNYAKHDNRIKIIDSKENKGVGISRNEGIKVAKGEYVGFVDSDDFIDLDFYEKLYTTAKNNNSDLVLGNIVRTAENGKETYAYKTFIDKIKQNKSSFYGNFFIGLYKKQLLWDYNIMFTPNAVYGEDRMFPIQAVYYAKNFKIVDDVYYHYFQRENSASKTFGKKQMEDYLYTTNLVLDFINTNNYSDNDKILVLEGFTSQALSLFERSGNDSRVYLKNLYRDFSHKLPQTIMKYFYLNLLNPDNKDDEIKKQAKIILNKYTFRNLRNKYLEGAIR